MNKLIFQIGLLAFLISTVIFGTEDYPLIDTIARAFMVFIAVIVTTACVLTVSVVAASRQEPAGQEEHRPAPKTAHPRSS